MQLLCRMLTPRLALPFDRFHQPNTRLPPLHRLESSDTRGCVRELHVQDGLTEQLRVRVPGAGKRLPFRKDLLHRSCR